MVRVPEWQDRLLVVIAKHQDMPGQWGVSDCWILTMDAIEAVTGERILPHLQTYASETEAYRLFRRHGYKQTVEEALAQALGDPISPLMAQRGDVGVIIRDGVLSCGVFTSAGFAVRSIYGHAHGKGRKRIEVITGFDLQFLPVTSVTRAYQVR